MTVLLRQWTHLINANNKLCDEKLNLCVPIAFKNILFSLPAVSLRVKILLTPIR